MRLHIIGPVIAEPQLQALMIAEGADGQADIRIQQTRICPVFGRQPQSAVQI
jgi:hypothetical protein